MTVGFVVWNPFQVFHMGPIADCYDDAVFVVVERHGHDALRDDFGGSVSSFIDRPHQIVTPRQLVKLDGQLDALVCPNPFPGMNALVSSRRIGVQYSMTKESYQYGTWRAQFDVNLAYGDYSARRLLRYGPVVAVGNPRFTPWFERAAATSGGAPPRADRRPTVLYLPTWGEFSSVASFLPAIDQLQDDYRVLAKLHHKSYLTEPGTIGHIDASNLGETFTPNDDLLPLIDEADVILSDYSGAIFDAIYVGKPVILLQDDPEKLIGKKFSFDSAEYARRDEIGPVVSSPDTLRSAVAGVLDGSIDFAERNASLRDDCFAEDIHAAERAAEVLASVVRHRRNPLSPYTRATTPGVIAELPVDERMIRFERTIEQQPAGSEVPGTAKHRGSPRVQARRLAKSALVSSHGPHLLRRAAVGPVSEPVRERLERMSLRLEPTDDAAISVLEARRSQRRLTSAEHLCLADALFVSGQNAEAAAVLGEVTLQSGAHAEALAALTDAYQRACGSPAKWDAQLGLTTMTVAPAVSAGELVSSTPTEQEVLIRAIVNAAELTSGRGDFGGAAALLAVALRLDDDRFDSHRRCARALDQAFRFEEARDALAETVRRGPLSRVDRRTSSRSATKVEDWPMARAEALACMASPAIELSREFRPHGIVVNALDVVDRIFDDPSVVEETEFTEALQMDDALAGTRPWEYWMAVHWRLIRCQRFSAAYRVKDLAARSVLSDLSESNKIDVRSTVVLARALMTLGRIEDARSLLLLRLEVDDLPILRFSLTKALADLEFYLGDLGPIATWMNEHREIRFDQGNARRAARQMVHGKRVVIAGPSASSEHEGSVAALRDGFDVIVRTNLGLSTITDSADQAGSADLVYFNSGITRLGLTKLIGESTAQGVRQVVLRRPRDLDSIRPGLDHGIVRLTEAEPGCHLFASSFGVQRIIYDLAAFEPASITVRDIDFFTGAIEYAPGYKVENADVSFVGFSHDYRGDFRMSRHMARTGAVRFDDVAATILNSSTTDYLSRLDAKPRMREG